ncbi:MAG TPA: hypothetical protein VFV67_27390 [Actinophytocola sp.]|uniref:hypothetical protein n=1 Tax=Actinophytocola sp. TaxID=1872138 RepID=UPI002DBD2025|nr:hypothetical protein [Actinophytocola sp.]HEU5474388.1 hypothetical protein [Actinophytocola sp.]
MTRWLQRLLSGGVPPDFTGELAEDENVLGHAAVAGGGRLVATSLGLWVPDDDGVRRIGWHLISKATWSDGVLAVVEAAEQETVGQAVVLADLPPRRFVLDRPGTVPRTVQVRVTSSIRSRHHHDLPGGGAWFVQRKVPGRDGLLLQVRPDPGADRAALGRLAAEVAERLRSVE